jgi:hypothetical protein
MFDGFSRVIFRYILEYFLMSAYSIRLKEVFFGHRELVYVPGNYTVAFPFEIRSPFPLSKTKLNFDDPATEL